MSVDQVWHRSGSVWFSASEIGFGPTSLEKQPTTVSDIYHFGANVSSLGTAARELLKGKRGADATQTRNPKFEC